MKKICLFLLLIGALISCDKKKESITPNIVTYPMTVGSQWNYDRQIVVNKYESMTSNKIVDTDTYNFSVRVWVDKDTVLEGKEVVKFMANSENVNHVNFHFLDSEGLKTYAYKNAVLIVFAKADVHFKSAAMDQLLAQDPIIYEQPPTMDIKLPLKPGLRWTYRQPTDSRPLKIEKQVTGTETLTLAGKTFDCYKIDYLFFNDDTYAHIQMTDWISDKGLVKRVTVFNDLTIQNEYGTQLTYGKSIETLTLTSVDIK